MKKLLMLLTVVSSFFLFSAESCQQSAVSTSGVARAQVKAPTDLEGHTAEQNNMMKKIIEDNKPGAIKHLYLISPMSGQVILYSTVKGKVTSGNKRLNPSTTTSVNGSGAGFQIPLDSEKYFYTDEVLSDDGAYGSSGDYIYWWDSKDIFHQQYVNGGVIIHISSEPIAVKDIILNLETTIRK